MSEPKDIRESLDNLVRRERGRLIAVLLKGLGNHHLELAEDAAQEALIEAFSAWSVAGIPSKPAAWLTTVARNKAIDQLRRLNKQETFNADDHGKTVENAAYSRNSVNDPELRLIFLSCHPALTQGEQIAVTLRLAGGFSARELGHIFLTSETAMAQRVSRGKAKLRGLSENEVATPTRFELIARIKVVLQILHLIFTAAYFPRSGETALEESAAMEAIRMTQLMVDSPLTRTPAGHALLAVMCFQASRFKARIANDGGIVVFADQDRTLWDRALIHHGAMNLRESQGVEGPGPYHYEAMIAANYSLAESFEVIDWNTILQTYSALAHINPSPVVKINRCIALALAGQPKEALDTLISLESDPRVKRYSPYYLARAYAYRRVGEEIPAQKDFARAARLSNSEPVMSHILKLHGRQ